ncbi:MAG: DUF1579 domain-containing protein [Phycisphaerales bacterium]|nr:DUF1579 domain-containing protein [Phycisphaerales bacterium]
MAWNRVLWGVAASGVAGGLAWASWQGARGGEPGTIDKRAFLERIQKAGAPGPQHETLSPLVGEFDCTMTLWPGQGMPAVTASARASGSWIMDGRFVQVMNRPAPGEELAIESMQVIGFDRRAAKYFCWSVDSTDTYGLLAKGRMDAGSATVEMTGTSDVPGRAPEAFKQVIRIESQDRYVTQVWLLARGAAGADADGWIKTVEFAYTRRADDAAGGTGPATPAARSAE